MWFPVQHGKVLRLLLFQTATGSKPPVPADSASASKRSSEALATKALASQAGPSPAIDVTVADQHQIDAENQNLVQNMTPAEVLPLPSPVV